MSIFSVAGSKGTASTIPTTSGKFWPRAFFYNIPTGTYFRLAGVNGFGYYNNYKLIASNAMDKTPYNRSANTYTCGQHETVLTGVTNEYDYDGWAIIRESNASSCVRPFVAHDGGPMIFEIGCGSLDALSYNTFTDNLMAPVDVSNQSIAATYGCSSAGFYYYGYRFYDPKAGRWVNRDPIEEKGGINLYAWCKNDGVRKWDLLGLDDDLVIDIGFDEPRNDTSSRLQNREQVREFPELGSLKVVTSAFYGYYRKIDFAWDSSKKTAACCPKLGVIQIASFENVDGSETQGRYSQLGQYFYANAGESDYDPPGQPHNDVWLPEVETGTGSLAGTPLFVFKGVRLRYWDQPGCSDDADNLDSIMEFLTDSGEWVERRINMKFITCIGCRQGGWAGKIFTCTTWSLSYPGKSGAVAKDAKPSIVDVVIGDWPSSR